MTGRTGLLQRVFPKRTRRGNLFDLGERAISILSTKGFKSFYQSVVRYCRCTFFRFEYPDWIQENEPDAREIIRIKEKCRTLEYRPKISIITPVWNPDEEILRLTIESVLNQVYPDWELHLVDGGSEKIHVKRVLMEYAEKDPRIKITFLPENKGIAGNSNEALKMVTGKYVGFLDHDDLLSPYALFEVVTCLNRNPDLVLIYSDEDKLDKEGNRIEPFFKPDWSPDLFLSNNYICHFTVILTESVASVGGFRNDFDGAQDYDLFLRITEKSAPGTIGHIPKILYHWRMTGSSESGNSGVKPYAIKAAKKALSETIARRGLEAGVGEGIFPGSYRVRYTIHGNPEITIIIPTKDKSALLRTCIQSILDKTTYQNYQILIVDNQSSEPETFVYYESLRNNEKIRIIHYRKAFNYSIINNYAVAQTTSPYILFMNNDIEVISEDWLTAMLEHIQREGVGAVGAKLLYPDNTVQHAGVIIGIGGVAGHSHKHYSVKDHGYFGRMNIIQDVSAVTAACMLMKKDFFQKTGGFDEALAIAFNDVDLCLRIRQEGQLIVYTPYAQLYHHESMSRGYEDTPEKEQRFQQEIQFIRDRWGVVIDQGDPFYNPNLTLYREDYSLNDHRKEPDDPRL